MKSILTTIFIAFVAVSFSQSFTIQNNYLTVSGSSTDPDFSENTNLDALNNGTVFWSIILDSIPQGWEFSNCFPTCYPVGTNSGTLNMVQGNSYFLNGHFYPNNIAGEGKMIMEIDDGNGTVEQVTWFGIAGSVGIINNYINSNQKQIKYIYNLNGQLVNEFTPNQLYIITYNDGSSGKIFVTQ
jgi:hypothetical protein